MKISKITLYAIVLISFLAFSLVSVNTLNKAVQSLSVDKDLENASWGILAVDIATDSVLIEKNKKTTLIPASALKVLTTAVVLDLLGENFKFETAVKYTGNNNISNGIIEGDLLVIGSGDPSIQSKYFSSESGKNTLASWADTLSKLGVKQIKGNIIADVSEFNNDILPGTWIWADIGNYYGSASYGLNIFDNLYTIHFTSYESGSKTKLKYIFPNVPGLEIENNVYAGGTTDNCYIYGSPDTYLKKAGGTIPPNKEDFDVDGALPDPPKYFAYLLDSLLRAKGIVVNGSHLVNYNDKKLKENAITAFVHLSPPLKEIVFHTNKKSVNLFAEALFRKTGQFKKGNTSSAACTEVFYNVLSANKIATSGMYLNDGSGLSRWNNVTCEQLVGVLKTEFSKKHFSAYLNSFPKYGENMYVKSGYITRVRSYAGYVKAKNGKWIAFAVIVNNYNCSASQMRVKLEKILKELDSV